MTLWENNKEEIDFDSDGFKLGVRIKEIETKIMNLPLADLRAKINRWESLTPMLDPSLFMRKSDKVQVLHDKVSILLKAQLEFIILKERYKKVKD